MSSWNLVLMSSCLHLIISSCHHYWQLFASFVNFCQLLASFNIFLQLLSSFGNLSVVIFLATFNNFLLLLATFNNFGNFWKLLIIYIHLCIFISCHIFILSSCHLVICYLVRVSSRKPISFSACASWSLFLLHITQVWYLSWNSDNWNIALGKMTKAIAPCHFFPYTYSTSFGFYHSIREGSKK